MPLRTLLHRLLPALCCLLSIIPARAADPLAYTFVKFPPFQYLNEETARAEGVTIDLLRAAALRTQQPLSFQQLPQQRLVQLTRSGRLPLALVSSLYIAPVRQLYHCSTEPLGLLRPTVYVNRAQFPDITALNQLQGQVIYAPQATSHTLFKLLPEGVLTDDSNPDRAIVRMFAKGRLGLVVDFQEHMEPPLVALSPSFAYRRLALPALDIVLCINPEIDDYARHHSRLEQAILEVAASAEGADIFARHGMFLRLRAPDPEAP